MSNSIRRVRQELPRRLALAEFLASIPSDASKWIIRDLALRAAWLVRHSLMSIASAEEAVFNVDVAVFCRDQLRDRKLTDVIVRGMELPDIQRHVEPDHSGETWRTCEDIEKRMRKYGE